MLVVSNDTPTKSTTRNRLVLILCQSVRASKSCNARIISKKQKLRLVFQGKILIFGTNGNYDFDCMQNSAADGAKKKISKKCCTVDFKNARGA